MKPCPATPDRWHRWNDQLTTCGACGTSATEALKMPPYLSLEGRTVVWESHEDGARKVMERG